MAGQLDNEGLPIHLYSPFFPSPCCLALSFPCVRGPCSLSLGLSAGPVYPGPL